MASRPGRGARNVRGKGSRTVASSSGRGASTDGATRNNGAWRRGGGTSASQPELSGRMDLIASVSRSSGLDKDGDALKDFKTQERYRTFIQGKLDDYHRKWGTSERVFQQHELRQRDDARGNLLILFRKLREGITASKRVDAFAIEVHETSSHYAILFNSPAQVLSALGPLPGLYVSSLRQDASPGRDASSSYGRDGPAVTLTLVLSMAYHLDAYYPSQVSYRAYLRSLPKDLMGSATEARSTNPLHEQLVVQGLAAIRRCPISWIQQIALTLRRRNWVAFGRLTTQSVVDEMLRIAGPSPVEALASSVQALTLQGSNSPSPFPVWETHSPFPTAYTSASAALHHLIYRLRSSARESAWSAFRIAYREWACHPGSETRLWLQTSLCLVDGRELDIWLGEKERAGGLEQKEGAEGRWIVCR